MRKKGWAVAVAAALGASPAAAGEGGGATLANAVHVRVNGAFVMQQDVQDTATLLLRTQLNNQPPADREGVLRLQSEAVRQQVRALLILEDMRQLNIRVNQQQYRARLKNLDIDPQRVPPAVRRLVEAQCVFREVLARNGIPLFPPQPREVRDYYLRHRNTRFRSFGYVKFRRALFYETRAQTRAEVRADVEREIARLRAVPAAERHAAVDAFIRARSMDAFAAQGGFMPVFGDSDEPGLGPEWANDLFPYADEAGGRPLPEPLIERMLPVFRAGVPGSFTPVVDTDLGLMFCYVEDARPGKVLSFPEVREFVEMVVDDANSEKRGRTWLRRKYDRSRIVWNDDEPYAFEDLLPPGGEGGARRP